MFKILVADDDPEMLNFVRLGLQSAGFQVITAPNGEGALQRALRDEPDLVLLDVMMPAPNGLSVCRELKWQTDNFVPIILMTARGDLDEKLEGFRHGADDFLVKPFPLEELVARAKSMLRIKTLQDDLRTASIADALTGIYNRRYFELHAADECSRALRYNYPLTCLMIDLDHFKEVNDRFGHPRGDLVLKQTVRLVQSLIRKVDVFIRYGGDEFILLLPGTPLAGGKLLADRIRAVVENAPFHGQRLASAPPPPQLGQAGGNARSAPAVLTPKEPIFITCSVGVCSFSGAEIKNTDEIVKILDAGLYEAKRAGRNRVYVVGATPVE